jgi:carboxypeptidase C (cathepsin A)
MSLSLLRPLVLAIVLAGTFHSANADDAKSPAQPAAAERQESPKGVLRLLPADAVTEHSIDTSRGKLAYTATAGTLAFYDQSGEQSAAVFYTAYVAKGGNANRPLTFVFNGGPGAASAFLHLGLVGPRILDFGPDPHDATRAALRDNPDTWLAFTDLVLIDPIGTGWPAQWPKQFRSMSLITIAQARRNICSAKATADSVPPRLHVPCRANRASSSMALLCSRLY